MILLALSIAAAVQAPPPVTADAKQLDADRRIVCKRLSRTGSRMAPKRVCLTGFEWRQTEARAQREVGDMKRQSRMEQMPSF